ncbi:phosphatase PAP2 family protein [Lentzea sp. NPDC051838]|uniref:phosphatase PAP2 family protein n=1 Tax=Lentzea sp. NPDC051838 TaxID=3154849 RepID=UPI00341537D1
MRTALVLGAAATLGGLAALAGAVTRRVHPAEARLAETAHRFGTANPGWVSGMRTLTRAGDHWVGLICGGGTAIALLCTRDWGRATAVGLATAAPNVAIVLRRVIERERPAGRLVDSTDNSFPSGHVTTATSSALVLGVALWPHLGTNGRRALVATGATTVAVVGVSRLSLAAHWPTDVLGGVLLASGSALLAGAATHPWWRALTPATEKANA